MPTIEEIKEESRFIFCDLKDLNRTTLSAIRATPTGKAIIRTIKAMSPARLQAFVADVLEMYNSSLGTNAAAFENILKIMERAQRRHDSGRQLFVTSALHTHTDTVETSVFNSFASKGTRFCEAIRYHLDVSEMVIVPECFSSQLSNHVNSVRFKFQNSFDKDKDIEKLSKLNVQMYEAISKMLVNIESICRCKAANGKTLAMIKGVKDQLGMLSFENIGHKRGLDFQGFDAMIFKLEFLYLSIMHRAPTLKLDKYAEACFNVDSIIPPTEAVPAAGAGVSAADAGVSAAGTTAVASPAIEALSFAINVSEVNVDSAAVP